MSNKIIAITGGIGSGKSAVMEIIKSLGYKTLSCDSVTASLYKSRKMLKKLKKIFPTAIKGKIFYKADKGEISKLVFNDQEKYKLLSDYMTIPTFNRVMKKAKKIKDIVFIEIPLLFEYGLENSFTNVIVVKRDIFKRINAVKKRSNLTEEQIKLRINHQIDYDNYDFSKFLVLENVGTKEDLQDKVNNLIKKII